MSTLGNPAANLSPVTPNDTTVFDATALLVTVAGNLSIESYGGTLSGVFPVPAGLTIPVRTKRVLAVTTATVMRYSG